MASETKAVKGEMKSDIESNSVKDAVAEKNDSNPEIIISSASTQRPSSTVRPPIRADDSVAEKNQDSNTDEINSSSIDIRSSYFHAFITFCVFYFYF